MSTERDLRAQRREQTREQRPTLSRGGSVSSRSSHASLGLGFNSPIQPSTTRHRPPGHCPESLEHILVEVLDLPPDGILAQALKHAKITCFIDLMAMTDVAIDSLVYPRSQTPDDEGDFQDDQLALVPLSIRSLIKVIQGYVYYRKHVHNDPVNPDNCMDIDYGSVLDYRASGEFLTFGNRPIPQPIIQKPSRRTPAAEFDRSIRRDPSSFPTFSNDKQWKNYNRNLAAICCTYGLQNVLNHKYRPQTVDEKDLFDRQQAFMYQVFTTTLLTDKGWQQLPDKAKAVILGASSDPARPPPPPPPPLPPRCLVNLHDISAAALLDHFQDASMGSASGALPPEVVDNARDSILAHVTERQSLKPGGANGGIAGDDVIILSQTNRSVEVRAIDDHQLTDVSIKTLPHIVLTSDENWDPGVLDSRVDEFDPKPDDGLEDLDPKVDDFDKWTDCITGDGLEGAKSRFDQVDILKRNKTKTTSKDSIFDEVIHFFETFQYASPFDEPCKDSECTDTGTDCPDTGPYYFDRNMVESSCPDPYYIDPPIFVMLEANKSCRHPSVLLVPDASIKFDVEVGPLFTKESSQELTHDLPTRPPKPKDTFTIDLPSKPRCNTSCKVRFGHGIWPGNGEQPDTGPPQRNKQEHKTLPLADTMVYKNPSSAVKSRERNWERLRQYFAWLPKHSFHCTTTDLARSPTNAHHEHKYHPLSPLPEPISCMVVLVGIAKHDCHNMTNIFLFLETNNVLLPSDICSALPPTGLHKRLVLPDGEELALPTITKSIDLSDGEELTPPTKIKSRDHKSLKTIVHSSDAESDIEDVLLEEKDLIGRTFLLSPDDEGYVQHADEGYVQGAKIVELNYKHNRNTDIQPARIQLCLNIDKGKYEHVMAYHEIHKWSETDKDNPIDTKLKQVVYHHHYIQLEQPSYYLGLTYSMTIGWKRGENTPEPLNIAGANESVTYAIYSRNHNLPENQGCKLLRNIVIDKRKFLCPTNQVKLRLLHTTTPKYMYNYKIQKDHNGVLRLNKLHGNTNWKHATKVEMDLLATYKVLVDMGRGTPMPKDHQKFRVQLVNALKHFDKHKPRLLPFGDLTYVLPNKTKPSCLLTDQSVVGIIHHMLNGTPIGFFSKEQSTVETATYGSEFVSTRTCVKQIMDLQQTLRYLGVPIKGQSYIFGDNECVVNSSSRPEAKLHKGHVALSFHRVREAAACNMLSFIHIDGVLNPADILSKHRGHQQIWPLLRTLMFWSGDTADQEV